MSAQLEEMPRIRRMVPADLDAVVAIEREVFLFPWTRGNFSDSIESGYHCLVLELGGEVFGYGVMTIGAEEGHLLTLSIAAGSQRKGWGERLLEALARIARGGGLLLVVAVVGAAPALSERFATIGLGALAATEVRLLTEAYLDDTSISFTPAELNEIIRLSAGHPAYVQRAAYHLFQNKLEPGFDWRAAYLAEARTQPVPGAPLPPAIFEGQGQSRTAESSYGDEQGAGLQAAPELLPLPRTPPLLPWAIPVLGALLLLTTTGNIALALLAAGVGAAGALLWARRGRS